MDTFVRSRRFKKRFTGIPNIDEIVENLVPGTMILIKEDEYSYIHNTFLNIFVTEGLQNGEENVLVVAKDDIKVDVYKSFSEINKESEHKIGSDNLPTSILHGIQNCSTSNDLSSECCNSSIQSTIKKKDKMFIAWRYKDLSHEKNDFKYNLFLRTQFSGHKLMDPDLSLDNILDRLAAEKEHRISIYSLLSPIYEVYEEYSKNSLTNVEKFLYNLRKNVKLNNHILMVSIPTYLYSKTNFDSYFDIVISLESNIFTGYLPNYKAVMCYEKIAGGNKIRVNNLDTLKYGIRFKSKKLVIEKINIPPDDIEPSRSCSSSAF